MIAEKQNLTYAKSLIWFLVCYIGYQSYVSCTLNSKSELSLMLCASTGNSAGENLSSLREILSKSGNVFVIYIRDLLSAECTNLLSLVRTERFLLCILRFSALHFFIQSDNLLF
jgi:hypothetical protein